MYFFFHFGRYFLSKIAAKLILSAWSIQTVTIKLSIPLFAFWKVQEVLLMLILTGHCIHLVIVYQHRWPGHEK